MIDSNVNSFNSDLISCEPLDCLQIFQYLSLEMERLKDKHFKNLNQFSANLLTLKNRLKL